MVAADDFSQNAAVDDGILELLADGRISAASCLAASPRWPRAARRIERALRARADIGLHLDLTEFVRPAGGHLGLLFACYAGALDGGRLRTLIEHQLQRFEDALGGAPDYVDGHRHVHQLPQVRGALLAALRARYGARLPWVRVSRGGGAGAGLKAGIVARLGGGRLAARCEASGVACNERLLGFYDFARVRPDHRPRLQAWLARVQSGDVLMCHPAARAEDGDPIGRARNAEFLALQGAWWPAALAAKGITLARGRDVVEAGQGRSREAAPDGRRES